jgi:hypothetical protein
MEMSLKIVEDKLKMNEMKIKELARNLPKGFQHKHRRLKSVSSEPKVIMPSSSIQTSRRSV